MPTNDHLWTHDEAARWLQISEGALKNARKRGEIEYLLIHNRVHYTPEAVRDYSMLKQKPARCGHCGNEFPFKNTPQLPGEEDTLFPRYVSDPVEVAS